MPTLPAASDVVSLTETTLASAVVDSIIADAALVAGGCIEGYEESRQTAIIKWLAAHLVTSTDASNGTLTSDKMGDASQSFARASMGKALEGTMYGQQALALDTNGCLIRKGRGRASVQVV